MSVQTTDEVSAFAQSCQFEFRGHSLNSAQDAAENVPSCNNVGYFLAIENIAAVKKRERCSVIVHTS